MRGMTNSSSQTISFLQRIWPLPENHRKSKLNIRLIDGQPYIVCLPPHPYVPAAPQPPEGCNLFGQTADIWRFLREHSCPGISIYWSYSNINASGMGPAYEIFSEKDNDTILIPVFAARHFRVSTGFHLCFIPLDERLGLLDVQDVSDDETVSLGTLTMGGRPVPDTTPSGGIPRHINNKVLELADTSLISKRERIQVLRVGSCFISVRPLLTNISYESLEKSGLVSPYVY